MPTIQKIREIVNLPAPPEPSTENSLETGSKSSEDEDSLTGKNEEEKPLSEEEILESLGLKDVARTSDGKIDHAKLAMKDRMAIVRGMRRKRKRYTNANKKASSSPDQAVGEDLEEDILDGSLEEGGEVMDSAKQYKGFVTDIEPFDTETPEFFDDLNLIEMEKKRRRLDVSSEEADIDQNQFLCSLNLFRPMDVSSIVDLLNADAQKKLNYRNLTYIPELSDKKHKISYTYLAPDINSPPLLRTRQRRPHPTDTAVSSRLTSRSNSRATTPERSITRQLSSASNESSLDAVNATKKEEKTGIENELSSCLKRWDELQSVLAANKRTISTRVKLKLPARILDSFLISVYFIFLEGEKSTFRGR